MMVGYGVEVARRVGSINGVGVQVGGSESSVAVGDGIEIVGIAVGLGNGLRSVSGSAKIDQYTKIRAIAATRVRIVRISHLESLFIARFPKSQYSQLYLVVKFTCIFISSGK